MNDYKRGSKFDRHSSGGFEKKGFNKFDNRRSFGGSNFDKPKYPASCAECGERCEVPFKPVNGRPVFCSNCFRRDDQHQDSGRRDERPSFDRRDERPAQARTFSAPTPAADYKRDFMELNRKLDEVMKAIQSLKAPTEAKPAVEKPKEAKVEAVETPKKKAVKTKEPATKKKSSKSTK